MEESADFPQSPPRAVSSNKPDKEIMMAKKSKKHPIEMTSDELAAHVFHPKVLKHLRKVIAEHNAPKTPRKSSRKSVK